MKQLEEYFYLDEPGINNLFGQINEEEIEKIIKKKSDERSLSRGFGISLGNFLRILGIGADLEADLLNKDFKSYEVESSLNIHYKIKIIKKYLEESDLLHHGIDESLLKAKNLKKKVYVDFEIPYSLDKEDADYYQLVSPHHSEKILISIGKAKCLLSTRKIGGLNHMSIRLGGGSESEADRRLGGYSEIKIFGFMQYLVKSDIFWIKSHTISFV